MTAYNRTVRFRFIEYDLVDSTSERAFAALESGSARDGDIHIARTQSAGRGRRGNSWESASSGGLYMSLIHMPEPAAGQSAPPPPGLTIAAGLALHGAVAELLAADGKASPSDLRLKWPNDLLLGGAKLAGILVESRGLDPAHPHYVIGIGLNVAQAGFSPELEAQRSVTSLKRAGLTCAPPEVLPFLTRHLDERLAQLGESPQALCDAFLLAARARGAIVRVDSAQGTCEGRLEGMSLQGLQVAPLGDSLRILCLEHIRGLQLLSSSD